jgi:hypothetical protein
MEMQAILDKLQSEGDSIEMDEDDGRDIVGVTIKALGDIDFGEISGSQYVEHFKTKCKSILTADTDVQNKKFIIVLVLTTYKLFSEEVSSLLKMTWIVNTMSALVNEQNKLSDSIISLKKPMMEAWLPMPSLRTVGNMAAHLKHLDKGFSAAKAKNKAHARQVLGRRSNIMQQISPMGKFVTFRGGTKPSNSKEFRQAWEEFGKPTDSDRLIVFLNSVGFNAWQIRKIFNDAGVSLRQRDDSFIRRILNLVRHTRKDEISRLAEITYQFGLEKIVINFLKKRYSRLSNKTNLQDSSHNFGALMLEGENETLSDGDLRRIFFNVSKQLKTQNSKLNNRGLMDYIGDWAEKISTLPSEEDRKALIRQMSSIMADNKTDGAWKELVPKVNEIIRQAQTDPEFIKKATQNIQSGKMITMETYTNITHLLVENDYSWNDLEILPTVVSKNKVRLDRKINSKVLLSENILREYAVLMYIKGSL